jgi:hypothetical protein
MLIESAVGQPRPDTIGAFRTVCEYSHMLADDPIVAPGRPGASHLHVFWGNTGANANSTYESLRNSGNSTCRGGIANRTGYWAPAVIDSATGRPIAPSMIHVYYKSGYEGEAPSAMHALPEGLRMIAGSMNASSPQGDFARWGCWNGTGTGPTIPINCDSGHPVVMQLRFPQCWDGKNLDSADHKSHMAYVDRSTRRCPTTHPVALPEVMFNVLYEVANGAEAATWRLSTDSYDTSQPGGYSIHGDWFDGWDPQIKQTWTRNCVSASVDCSSHLLGDGRMQTGAV